MTKTCIVPASQSNGNTRKQLWPDRLSGNVRYLPEADLLRQERESEIAWWVSVAVMCAVTTVIACTLVGVVVGILSK